MSSSRTKLSHTSRKTVFAHQKHSSRVLGRRRASAGQRASVDHWCSVRDYALNIWEALDSPISLSLSILLKNGEYEQIVRKDVDPRNYVDAFNFYLDYQAVKLLSKNPWVPTGIDRRKAAEKKFVEAEVQCLLTNSRFRDSDFLIREDLCRVLMHAQGKISDILGPVPTLAEMDFRFGPGAAYGVKGHTTAYHKLTADLQCTHTMTPILGEFLAEFPALLAERSNGLQSRFGPIAHDTVECHLIPGSRLDFVPKDAKTDRSICIEPVLNGFMQKGIGAYIRNRLKRHGIDLDDQSRNQFLASKAVDDGLVTADFSSASDTIAYNLVWNLLPPDWATLLDIVRCPRFTYEGEWYNFQKFSSMGNAYTFELETLIFYALAYACCTESGVRPITGVNLSVYGDDVIIPVEAFDSYSRVSEACGFTLNVTKTYRDGLFRESCGSDYFAGVFVTPFRLKKAINAQDEVFYAANLITRMAERVASVARTKDSPKAWSVVRALSTYHSAFLQCLPRRLLAFGPWDESDQWILAPFDRVCPSKGFFGYWHKRIATSPQVFKQPEQGWPLSYALYAALSFRDHDLWDDLTPLVASEGAPTRRKGRVRMGWYQSQDWHWPTGLLGYF